MYHVQLWRYVRTKIHLYIAEDMPSKLMEDEELRSAVKKAVSLESGCAKALAAKVSMHGPRVSAYYVDNYVCTEDGIYGLCHVETVEVQLAK